MSDEAKVRDLFQSVARPVDLDGRLFKVDRARAIGTILGATKDTPQRLAGSKSRRWLGVGLAASLALAASAALALRGQGTRVVAQRSLSIGELRGPVTPQSAARKVPVAAGNEAKAISAASPPALPGATPAAPPIATDAAVSTSSSRPTKPRERGVEGKALGGTLDQENRLFQAGLAAERGGDFRTASRSLEQLLAAYPASPLAADARLALARVKSHLAQGP